MYCISSVPARIAPAHRVCVHCSAWLIDSCSKSHTVCSYDDCKAWVAANARLSDPARPRSLDRRLHRQADWRVWLKSPQVRCILSRPVGHSFPDESLMVRQGWLSGLGVQGLGF